MRVNWFFFICFMLVIVAVIFPQIGSAATSLTGTTGLINIPTAYIIPDGKMAFGVGYTDKNYSLFTKYTQVAYYATVGYFPFLEASFRVTTFPGSIDTKAYGMGKDRMISIKFLITKDNRYLPSILFGIHDIRTAYQKDLTMNAMKFNTTYIVCSKSFYFWKVKLLDVHLGYATKLIKNARYYSMLGVFAGVEMNLCKFLSIMGEYDTEKYNAGLRIMPFGGRLNIDIDTLGMKRISGGASFSFGL